VLVRAGYVVVCLFLPVLFCPGLCVTLCPSCVAVGLQGSMTPMGTTLIGRAADGSRHHITPPPPHVLPADSIEAAQVRGLWGGVEGETRQLGTTRWMCIM